MPQFKRPLIIGVTGSIASGKSAVCRLLRKYFTVISADRLAHQVLNRKKCRDTLFRRWGEAIIKNGRPDRSKIANLVFGNEKELAFLNSLIHPEVLKLMQKKVVACRDRILVFEVPLLFEANLDDCFDYILLVDAAEETRLQRLISKRNASNRTIRLIIRSQTSDLEKKQRADTVISNNGSLKDLKKQAEAFVSGIRAVKHRPVRQFASLC